MWDVTYNLSKCLGKLSSFLEKLQVYSLQLYQLYQKKSFSSLVFFQHFGKIFRALFCRIVPCGCYAKNSCSWSKSWRRPKWHVSTSLFIHDEYFMLSLDIGYGIDNRIAQNGSFAMVTKAFFVWWSTEINLMKHLCKVMTSIVMRNNRFVLSPKIFRTLLNIVGSILH